MRRILAIMAAAIGLLTVPQSASCGPKASVKDCRSCPDMVVLAGGEFLMGSPQAEAGRYPNEPLPTPQRVGAFAIGRTEVTRRQFAAFAAATGRTPSGGCYTPGDLTDLLSDLDPSASWVRPGYAQTDDHPVVCVSWDEAVAYAAWLTSVTGHRYRLPTEVEWEYAARAGAGTAYPWGEDAARGCDDMNGGDLALGRLVPAWAAATRRAREGGLPQSVLIACDDGVAFTASVAHYRPNRFGLYDMAGNVWEWVQDCGDTPGAAAPAGSCEKRRTRGGSWDDWAVDLRSAVRKRLDVGFRRNDTGFRVVRELEP